jgi:hypothetical protein
MDEEALLAAVNSAESLQEPRPKVPAVSKEDDDERASDAFGDDYTADDDIAARAEPDDDDVDDENVFSIDKIKSDLGYVDGGAFCEKKTLRVWCLDYG